MLIQIAGIYHPHRDRVVEGNWIYATSTRYPHSTCMFNVEKPNGFTNSHLRHQIHSRGTSLINKMTFQVPSRLRYDILG